MRLWSIDFRYLDSKGLVALWRESLLAKNVLENKTKGYKNHPQLIRFNDSADELIAINTYLYYIYLEACTRNYHFKKTKIDFSKVDLTLKLIVSRGQLDYEFEHLLAKLAKRDEDKFLLYKNEHDILASPIFEIVEGKVASWEKAKK